MADVDYEPEAPVPADPAGPERRPEEPVMGKGHQVGVLFVHGMGEQGRGDTIGQMGEAVAEWLRRESEARVAEWLRRESEARVAEWLRRESEAHAARTDGEGTRPNKATIRHVALVDPHPELPDTAQIHIAFEPALTDDEKRTGKVKLPVARWLLSESWWAESFRPASFLETALWTIGVGPWIIAAQLDAILRRTSNVFSRFILVLILGLAAAVAAAVITPLAVLLLILALLPIPWLRNLIAGIQRNLAGSFGDLSILVRNPVQFAAMWSKVEGDIQAMSAHCDRVVVVAHSQGSAIAWMALRRWADRILTPPEERRLVPPVVSVEQVRADRALADDHGATAAKLPRPEPVALFISFGQAMRKLKMLYLLHTEASSLLKVVFLVLSLFGTAALLLAAAALFSSVWDLAFGSSLTAATDSWRPSVLVTALVILVTVQLPMVLLSRGWVAQAESELTEEVARVSVAMPKLRWLDLWASADPAPNGPLFETAPDGVSTYKVRNLGSTILDHTTYWSNTTEFVSEIVEQINAQSDPQPLVNRDAGQKRATVQVRDARIRMLTIGRVVFFASLASAIAIADGPAVGRGILSELGGLIGQSPEWEYAGLLGYGALIAVGLAAWYATLKGFNAIVGVDATAYFRGEAPTRWTPWAAAGWVAIGAAFLGTAYWLLSNGHQVVAGIWFIAVSAGVVLVSSVLTRGGQTLNPSSPR